MRWIIRLDKYQIVHHHNKVPLIPLAQYCNIHIFLSFLGPLLKPCILFEIFLRFSLPPPPHPIQSWNTEKILDTRVQHCLRGEGRGWICLNWKTPQKCYPGYQRFFSRAAGIFGVGRRPKPEAARVTIKTWQKPETALEKSLAPRVQKCESVPRLLSMIVVYLYNFYTPYWYPPQINIISSKKQLECFLKGGANSSIYAITHKIQRLLAYLPALSCASTLAPFCSSNSAIRAIPSDEVIVRELLGSEVADADQGLCTAQDYQCNYSS